MKDLYSKGKDELTGIFQKANERARELIFPEKMVLFITDKIELIKDSDIYNRINAVYSNLGGNERKVVKWALAGAGAFLLFMLFFAAVSFLGGYKNRIEKAEDVLDKIKEVKRSFRDSETAIRELRRTFRAGTDFKVASFVEEKATESGIRKIDAFDLKGKQKKEFVNVTRYLVRISKVHLRNIVDFLYKVENSGHPIFVNSLKMTRLFSNVKYFNLEMILSHKVFNEEKKNEK